MKKLLDHFKAMQGKVSAYLQPDGGSALAVLSDLIGDLDGPAQREAQAEAEASLRDYDALLGVECDAECQTAFWEAVEDVKSHAGDFRNALRMALDNSDGEQGDGYWQHQLDVLARILKGLENVSPPGKRAADPDAYTFDAEEVAAGQGMRGQPVEPPFGCKPALQFPDEPFPGVDPAPGKNI